MTEDLKINWSALGATVGLGALAIIHGRSQHGLYSWTLSKLDLLGLAFNKNRGIKFFNEGLGDTTLYSRAKEFFSHDYLESVRIFAPTNSNGENRGGINILRVSQTNQGSGSKSSTISILRAAFQSPIAQFLPNEEAIRQVNVEIVSPGNVASLEDIVAKGSDIVFHLPGTSDEGFQVRRKYFAQPLAQEFGITSVIMQLPFYGQRRLQSQKSPALTKVEYMLPQSVGAVTETIAVIRYLRDELNFKGKIGIAGLSFGGSMAALATVLSPYSVATVALVPANGPNDAFCQGIMSECVDWSHYPKNGREDVSRYLSMLDIRDYVEHGRDLNGVKKVYIQISALDDHYIKLSAAEQLYRGMNKLRNLSHIEYHRLSGGHISAIVKDRQHYLQSIHKALSFL